MAETAPDLARYERYWSPRRRRLLRRVRGVWDAFLARLPGFGRGDFPPEPPDRPFDPALVPVGPPRRPRPSSAIALEPPGDAFPDDLVAYPKETD